MARLVNLYSLPYFREQGRLQELQWLAKTQADLMPHQLAVATGCSLDAAMEVLMLLYHLNAVDAFLLVYHDDHPTVPALAIKLSEGLPVLPFTCDVCEGVITDRSHLLYDFLFKFREPVQFVSEDR